VKSFDEILAKAKELGPKTIAVAGNPDEALAAALAEAEGEGMGRGAIFPDASRAVQAARQDEADVLLKGSVETTSFMAAILDRQHGLRSGQLISHIAIIEAFGRLLLFTDCGVCLHPTLEEKLEIVRNALPLARALEMAKPKIAVLAVTEKVNPKMPETVDAAELSQMAIPGCVIQGPLAVDLAICPQAAKVKGITGPVAGQADILLVPSVLVGNIFAKGVMYFGRCRFGGVVAGTSRPVAFLSRADTAEVKLNTIALGILMTEGS